MIWYTLLMMVLGFGLGNITNLTWMSKLILPIVFIMIYPMMVNMSLAHFKNVKGSIKPIIEALLLNFIFALLLFYILTLPLTDELLKLALLLLAVAPASSMGLGYLGLSKGHLVSGTLIVVLEFLLAIVIYPLASLLFTSGTTIQMSMGLFIEHLLIILVAPLVLGVITREIIERKFEEDTFKKTQPYFATITLIFLYILIFSIFATKAKLIIKHYINILLIAPIAILFYGIMIVLTTVVNKKILKMEYGLHQSVVFTSIGKNVAMTIAILIAEFGTNGEYMAIAPAIFALFQAPIFMTYLKLSPKIEKYLSLPEIKKEIETLVEEKVLHKKIDEQEVDTIESDGSPARN